MHTVRLAITGSKLAISIIGSCGCLAGAFGTLGMTCIAPVLAVATRNQTICAIVLKALNGLSARAWIFAPACRLYTACVIQYPVATFYLFITGLLITMVMCKIGLYCHEGAAYYYKEMGRVFFESLSVEQRYAYFDYYRALPPARRELFDVLLGIDVIRSFYENAMQEAANEECSRTTQSGISCQLKHSNGWERIELQGTRSALLQNADVCLKLLTAALRQCQNFKNCGFKARYEGEPVVDGGGPSAEFFNDLPGNLAKQERKGSRLSLHQNDSAYYDASDNGQEMNDHDRAMCRNIGELFGALLAGFMANKPFKLGNFFSPQFYAGLLFLHRQRIQGQLNSPTEICLLLAQMRPDHPLYGLPLTRLSSCHKWKEDQKTELMRALTEMQTQIQLADAEIKIDLPVLSHNSVLENINYRASIIAFIEKYTADRYIGLYHPMCTILDGIESIPGSKERMQALLQSGKSLLENGEQFAKQIQGEPFSRARLLTVLPRLGLQDRVHHLIWRILGGEKGSLINGPARAWVIEWLQDPHGATDEEGRLFLKYVTGSDVISNTKISIVASTLRRIATIHHRHGRSTFSAHTCGATLNVPEATSKAAFIEALRIAIKPSLKDFNTT